MSRRIACALIGAIAVSSAPLRAAEKPQKPGRELHFLEHMDESLPLRDIKPTPPDLARGEWEHPVGKLPYRPRPLGMAAPRRDPVLQAQVGPLVAANPVLNFDGVGVGLAGFSVTSAPPDTNGAVGATQYVQWVNTSFAVFNKATGAVVPGGGPRAGSDLWAGFGGPCEANNDGDPIALYDKAANRWVMTQFSVTGGQFLQCVAVSTTSDATGSYRRFAFSFANFNDYPKVGVWPDGYYISFNMFNAAGTAFLGGRACALDRNQMITASGTPAPMQCFQLSSSFGGLLPSDLDGATPPPAGSPNYFLAFDDVARNGLNLWKFHVNWAAPANSTFTGPTKIAGAAFTEACAAGTCVPQPATTQRLDSLADRLMYRLAYRNFGNHEALVVNHSVDVSGHAGVRWYEVRSPNASPTVFQQGTFSPDANYRWMGSIAMDRAGNMMMGYSTSSGTVRPSVRYTGRLASDALGTMQAETEMFAGTGSQLANLSRWGDYSAMTVDPSDDCTFWFTTEYLKANGTFNWSTRVGSFKFPSCGATPDYTLSITPTSRIVTAGGSTTYTVNINRLNGFTGSVGFTVSGLPAGATSSFSPNPTTGNSSTLSVTTAVGTSGTFTLTATGTSGSLVRNASATLQVNPPAVPGFSVSVSPTSVSVPRSGSGSTTATVTSINGFGSAVTLSASGLPSGVTATFGTNPVTPPANGSANSTLNLSASASATTGTFTVTVTGTSGGTSRSATFSLTVPAAGPVTVFYNGAESPTTTLTFSSTTTSTVWTRNSTSPFAGSWRWRAGSSTGGSYGNNGDARMTTPTLNLSGASTVTLTYAFKHSTETNFDFFQVRISTNGGTTWTNLVNVSGNSANWSLWAPLKTINLNAYAGQTNVRIQFRLTTDVSVTAFGAAVDEIKVVKQ
jgi:hypothetical protein